MPVRAATIGEVGEGVTGDADVFGAPIGSLSKKARMPAASSKAKPSSASRAKAAQQGSGSPAAGVSKCEGCLPLLSTVYQLADKAGCYSDCPQVTPPPPTFDNRRLNSRERFIHWQFRLPRGSQPSLTRNSLSQDWSWRYSSSSTSSRRIDSTAERQRLAFGRIRGLRP